MKTLFKNIKKLVQVRPDPLAFVAGKQMKELPTIKNAYLMVEDGLIADFGAMEHCPTTQVDEQVDASEKMILPSWCDSHTHIVFAGHREKEFIDRINGLSYEEIANRGGGILHSAKKLQETSEEALYRQSKLRLDEVIRMGTGAIEIKSGYGLSADSELKMLRVIKRLKENYPVEIKATFLGAHALPEKYKKNRQAYLKMLIEEALPVIAEEELAEYIDVFCETDYFTVEEMEQMLKAGRQYGLIPKVHVNQFSAIGGVQAAIKHNALSVDHLEKVNEADIEALKGSLTMPVALPGCSYFLGISYTPARKIIDAGLPLALATDYNPGSAPSGNMHFVVSAACIKMSMNPEEAFNAVTINGAYAMGLEKKLGSITVGKQANLLLTKPIPSYGFIPYAFGSNFIEKVYVKGKPV